MEALFHMTVEQNIFVAKRNIVDYIWRSAKLEGLGVTYPDTEDIYNGMTAQGVSVEDTIAVNNLKHAWRFLLECIDQPTSYPLICRLNQLVGGGNLFYNAGSIRNIPVKIGGTKWTPPMPIESAIKEELDDILRMNSPTERAVTLMLHCMRRQMFMDGNKRTAMLAGNHVLIQSGGGVLSVPIEQQRPFRNLLVRFYETGDMEELKQFVYNCCIDGVEFPPLTPEITAVSFTDLMAEAKAEADRRNGERDTQRGDTPERDQNER